jgi:hypothetical protein
MSRPITRQFRVFSLGILILAFLFLVFFDRSKHAPVLRAANPFNVDPYDAVGSFGVLLSLFTALPTVLRAFRPYAGGKISPDGVGLILRGAAVVVLSIAVTLAADAIAVLRQASETLGAPGGRTLIGLAAALAIMDAGAGGWLMVRMQDMPSTHGGHPSLRAVLICLSCTAVLATYPPAWDASIIGGIFTALLGMLILFATVWALATLIFPADEIEEDLMDDVGAAYDWLKDRVRFLGGLDRVARLPGMRTLTRWLNPRQHPWHATALGGVVLGLALAAAEALGEGMSPEAGRIVLVSSVFIGIASAGVLVGYGLLGRFLGMYRPAATDKVG